MCWRCVECPNTTTGFGILSPHSNFSRVNKRHRTDSGLFVVFVKGLLLWDLCGHLILQCWMKYVHISTSHTPEFPVCGCHKIPFCLSLGSMLSAPVHQLWSSLPHNLLDALAFDMYILHIYGWYHLLCFNTWRLLQISIRSRNKNSQFPPLQSSPVCGVIMFLYYAAVVILHWPEWLLEMHACDQSAVACWSRLFPDIVHSPQAPTTDNGSLCQDCVR